MKKFLSLFLSLALALSLFSIPVSAEGFFVVQTIENIDYEGTTLAISASVTGNVAAAYGYGAVYSSDHTLKGAAAQKLTNPTAATYTIENYTYSSGDYVKVFLWDENHAPISESAAKELSFGEKIEGIVIETYLSCPYHYEPAPTVTIFVTKSSSEAFPAGEVFTFSADGFDVADLIGSTVSASVTYSENSLDVINSIVKKENSNTYVTVQGDLIVNIEPDEIIYYESDSARTPVEAAIDSFVYAGGIEFNLSDTNVVINGFNTSYHLTDDFFDIAYDLDEITLLDNDNDGAFEFIFANAPTYNSLEFVVSNICNEDDLWVFSTNDESMEFEIDNSDDSAYYKIIRNGEEASASDITIGDVITCLDADVCIYTIYVSSTRIEGTVDEVDDDVYTINATDYKISPLYTDNLRAGTSGIFYINAFNKIAHVELPQLNYSYFYLTDTATEDDTFDGCIYLLKGITASGEEIAYPLRKRGIDIYTLNGNAIKVTDDTAYDYFSEYRGVLKIVLDENMEIFTVVFPDTTDDFETYDRYEDDSEYESGVYNDARNTYGNIKLSPDTIIFNVNSTDNSVTFTTVKDSFTDGSSYSFIAYGAEDEIAPVLVAFDLNAPEIEPEPIIYNSEYVFLIDYTTAEDAFGETNYYVQIMTVDGTVDPYVIHPKNVTLYTKEGTTASLSAEEAYNLVSSYVGVAKVAFTDKDTVAEFYLPGCEAFTENKAYENTPAVYNKADLTLGDGVIDGKTILINIDTKEEDLDASLSAHKAYKALVDATAYTFTSYGKEGEAIDVILAKDLEISYNAEETVMVVTKVADAIYNKKDAVKITGVKDGASFSVYVTPGEYEEVNLAAGNIFIYTPLGDYATDIQLLFNSTLDAMGGTLSENLDGIITDDFSDDYVSIHYGEITDKTTKAISIDDDKFYAFDEMNIIVVDYTGSSTSVSTTTWSGIKASNAKFERTAFIKTISNMEDEISDIVMFIEEAQ